MASDEESQPVEDEGGRPCDPDRFVATSDAGANVTS
jgi:hypothetical protein